MNPLGHQVDSRPQSRDRARRNRRWIWFFVLLSVLGLCAMIIPWVYNVAQQLRPEQFAAARALWNQQRPSDYNLEYVVKEDDKPGGDASSAPGVESVSIQVRQGRVDSAMRNGNPLSPEEEKKYGVDALFDLIQAHLEHDGQPGQPRAYAHARFDKQDGHPVHYVRRVMGSRERLEIIVELWRPDEKPAKKLTFPDRN
jgi:Family of unknown function (DUF6174)